MSLEIEDQRTVEQPAETNYELQKKPKITYTTDFLISLSELDVCKNLPNGFDQSLLSEFEDALQDRQKGSGSLSMQSFRRNEYGSSPPTRGESGNYSRGRWDSRSSGRSDRDGDPQSDWDSDTGRRYGSQSRRSWQVPEHDGLLGSGSLARPSAYATGASAPKFRANDHYQPNRSNEPYHPPRPYKAVPHNRRETTDSLNDETFGSSEFTTEDRAEEERKRRASFELMRKEQQKAFQEKQKLNTNKRKDEFDITTLMEDPKDDEGVSNKSNQFDDLGSLPDPSNEPDKSVLPTQTPASRPLVPPGFTNASLERNIGSKTIAHPHSLEVGNSELEGGILHGKGKRLLNGTFDNQEKLSAEQIGSSHQHESINALVTHNNESDKIQKLTSAVDVSNKKLGTDGRLDKTSNLSKAVEASEESEGIELDAEKVTDNKIDGETNRDQPSSILNKLFGNVLTANGGGSNSLVEHHDSKAEDVWSPTAVQSSKFAHWFLEEEKKPVANLSSGRPNDLLSLIVGGEKGGSHVSDVKATRHIPSHFPSHSPELGDRHLAPNTASIVIENPEHLCDININKPAVLTCEDLEQSILSEISDSDATLPPTVRGWSVDAKTEQKKVNIDDHASQHLLSLLQKSTDLKDVTPSPGLDIRFSEILHGVDEANIGTGLHDSRDANAENISSSGKSLTLETLFGSAFMKELQSVGAPSSAQKGSIGSAIDALETHDGLLSSKVERASSRTSYESSILASNHREQMKTDSLKEHLLGLDNCQSELNSSQVRSELELKLSGFDGSADIRLPEEDSLITLGDPMKHLKNSSKAELFSIHAAPVDITEKLAALNSSFGDERSITGGQEGSPFRRGPYDVREADIPFHNLHLQPSSAQLRPTQLNHVGQLFNPLDSHPAGINSQMKFMAPESTIHHDPPPTHPFPANMLRPPFHHPSTGLAGFDPPTPHHPMFQQMHMPGNFPAPHLLRGFPNGPHSNSQMTGFMQDPNPMPGFPFGHQQPNIAGLGIPPPAPDIGGGSNNPEALQRLIEMEIRSKSKHVHPFAAAGPNQGMYNQELDMGSRYR
ncbi:hypothetical protein ACOSQ4_000938 [Xanthoceras sorbifolium]